MKRRFILLAVASFVICLSLAASAFADISFLSEEEMGSFYGKGTCAQRWGCSTTYACEAVGWRPYPQHVYTDVNEAYYGYPGESCGMDLGPFTVCVQEIFANSASCSTSGSPIDSIESKACTCSY